MSSQDDVYRRGAAIVSQIISSIREDEESNSTEALSALELPQPTDNLDSLSSSTNATTKSRPHSRISSVSASSDTRSDIFDQASITSSITSRASTPLCEQDNMTLPSARVILLHALERLAPHITLERLQEILRLISVDIKEREFHMLSTVVRCSCPPTGQLTTRCTICDMNICKSCGYNILQACFKDRQISENRSSSYRKHTLAAKRIRSFCHRETCVTSLRLIPGTCNCTLLLMDSEYKTEMGQYRKNCIMGVMGELEKMKNTKEMIIWSVRNGEETLQQYLCDCGAPADFTKRPYCRMCLKFCMPFTLNLDTKNKVNGGGEGGQGWNNGRCPYFYIPGRQAEDIKTVEEMERIGSERFSVHLPEMAIHHDI